MCALKCERDILFPTYYHLKPQDIMVNTIIYNIAITIVTTDWIQIFNYQDVRW